VTTKGVRVGATVDGTFAAPWQATKKNNGMSHIQRIISSQSMTNVTWS